MALPLLDTIGRWPLTLIGLTDMALGLASLSYAFHQGMLHQTL